LLSLQDKIDDLDLNNALLCEENDVLVVGKGLIEIDVRNVRRANNRLSATFASEETLSNPNMNMRCEDKNNTMCERLDHLFTQEATFKNLKNERKGKVMADVVWDTGFLDAEAKHALFMKARAELRETHFDALFILEEIDKSGAKMNFTDAELLCRVDKQGEEHRTGEPTTKKFYGSVIPSRGQLSSVSATLNRHADNIIAIEQISTASREG
jgi:hypothetical protein